MTVKSRHCSIDSCDDCHHSLTTLWSFSECRQNKQTSFFYENVNTFSTSMRQTGRLNVARTTISCRKNVSLFRSKRSNLKSLLLGSCGILSAALVHLRVTLSALSSLRLLKRPVRPHQTAPRVGFDHIAPSVVVRDLGILQDADLSVKSFMVRTVSSCFLVLWQLRSIRRSVPRPVFQSLVVTLVFNRLDFGIATLVSTPQHLLKWLQSVLNSAAWLT